MLAVSPLRSTGCKDEREEENIDRFSIAGGDQLHQEEFSCGSLLDSIDFDDIFIGIGDGDVLPDLEIDSSDMLADFSVSNGEADSSDNQLINVPALSTASDENNDERNGNRRQKQEQEEDGRGGEGGKSTSGSSTTNSNLNSTSAQAAGSDQEIVSKSEEVVHESVAKEESDSNDNNNDNNVNNNSNNNNKGRKSSGNNQNKGSQGKRKVKVDWTPELHRRFVQAVEQLGMDKAVPSKILEIMGIDCLTRHNIASHLQKYRSHQKHLRAREAEAASWSQRRQVYGGGAGKRGDMSPWLAPTMGFPHHPLPPPPATSLQPFRPLHVWGHPTHHVHDHHQASLMHIWPKHLAHHHLGPSPLPQPPWMPQPPPPMLGQPPPPPDPSYWHLHHQRVPNALTPGTPCFPQTLATRFPVPPVPGIPQHGMYKVDQSIGVVPTGQSDFQTPFDHFQPSKESIDAAIGDVLSKPWLPLPLGLKPPSLDSVMVELQRQGIPRVPPSAA